MYISGLQKLTLLDYPGHLAATLFLDASNFRCPFCHNRGLVLQSEDGWFLEDEVLKFLKKRAGMLDGVCISGGEPTLHRDLPALIGRVKELGYDVKLDTNGTNPDMLRELLNENLLDYIAMDVKAGRGNYAAAAGIQAENSESLPFSPKADRNGFLSRIQRSIDIIRNSETDYEFRTTVVKGIHTDNDFRDIAQWLAGSRRFFLQSFRDCDTILLPDHNFSAFPEEDMLRILSIIKKTIPDASLRGMEP